MNFRVAIHEKSLALFIENAHLILDNIVYQDKNRPLDHASLQHFDLDNGQYDSTQQTVQFKTAILNHPRYTQNQAQLSLENLTVSNFAFNIDALQLQTGNVSWQNAELFDTKQNTLLFKLPQASFSKLVFDFKKKALSIASIQASNADFRAWLNSQGELNYQTLLPEDEAQVNSEKQADMNTSDAFWGVKIDAIDLTNFSATFEDKSLPKPLSISIKPLSLKATNINTDKGSTLPFELNTGVNSGGSVHIKGNAGLNPLSTQSDIEVSAIGLDKFQSYVDKFAHIDVIKGVFNLEGRMDVAQGEQGELDVKFKGNSGIARLITRDQVQNKDLIKWDNLSLKNIEADLLAQRYIASSLLIEKPYARIIIGKDKRLNFSDMLIDSTATKETAKNNKKTSTTSSDIHFQLDKVRISNGASSFSDLSMILPFSAEIKGLDGGASGISSEHESTINITLKGNAYDLAPVDIKGKIQPYIGDYNAALNFKGMPLPLVSAYMAEFFGYKVEKGKMSLGVNYNVKNGELTADNNLLIEQFELGEQIDNPHAIDAPFNLAITLLKDVNGIINLNVPINGSLNDPQFDLGGVIGDAVLNILTKAISSPFQSIANLLGTDEDLSAVQFAPGQADLSEWQKPKLDSIAKVLKERTVLKLEIKATAFQSQDWNVLREDALTDRLKTLKAEEINRKGDRKIRPEYVELDEADTQRLLAQEFKEKFPQLVKRSFFGSLELAQPELGDFYSVAKETLSQSLPVEQKRLTKLAAARARSIAKYIVQTGGVPNERVFILDTAIDPPRQDNDIDTLLFLKAD
jgi:outer membrane protein OmpA-like peptidoglycan-associated protein